MEMRATIFEKPPEGHKNQKDTNKAVFLTEISFKIQRLVVEMSKEWVLKILIAKCYLLTDNIQHDTSFENLDFSM